MTTTSELCIGETFDFDRKESDNLTCLTEGLLLSGVGVAPMYEVASYD